MKFEGVSAPDYLASRPVLRFAPPMRFQAAAPDAFDFRWRLLQYCFDFPDPASAVPSTTSLSDADGVVVDRFVAKALSLAESPFLGYPAEFTVHVEQHPDGKQSEEVTTQFPHEESERGFMTLLRQFAHEAEPASFKRVSSIAVRHDLADDGANASLLRDWGKYHKKLLHRSAEGWFYIKAFPGTPLDGMSQASGPRVDQLLRTYFYGDLIHFGEGRDELDRLSQSEFEDARSRMNMYRGASDLALYYMGYATVIQGIFASRYPQSQHQ